MLAYDAAVEMVDKVKLLTGREAFSQVTDLIQPRTMVQNMSNLPATGACVVISNHPTGLADGLAVFRAIQERITRRESRSKRRALRGYFPVWRFGDNELARINRPSLAEQRRHAGAQI